MPDCTGTIAETNKITRKIRWKSHAYGIAAQWTSWANFKSELSGVNFAGEICVYGIPAELIWMKPPLTHLSRTKHCCSLSDTQSSKSQQWVSVWDQITPCWQRGHSHNTSGHTVNIAVWANRIGSLVRPSLTKIEEFCRVYAWSSTYKQVFLFHSQPVLLFPTVAHLCKLAVLSLQSKCFKLQLSKCDALQYAFTVLGNLINTCIFKS